MHFRIHQGHASNTDLKHPCVLFIQSRLSHDPVGLIWNHGMVSNTSYTLVNRLFSTLGDSLGSPLVLVGAIAGFSINGAIAVTLTALGVVLSMMYIYKR